MKKTAFIRNWKTASSGIIIATAIFLKAKGIIDATTFEYIIAAAGALGFISAKDYNVSGKGSGNSASIASGRTDDEIETQQAKKKAGNSNNLVGPRPGDR